MAAHISLPSQGEQKKFNVIPKWSISEFYPCIYNLRVAIDPFKKAAMPAHYYGVIDLGNVHKFLLVCFQRSDRNIPVYNEISRASLFGNHHLRGKLSPKKVDTEERI